MRNSPRFGFGARWRLVARRRVRRRFAAGRSRVGAGRCPRFYYSQIDPPPISFSRQTGGPGRRWLHHVHPGSKLPSAASLVGRDDWLAFIRTHRCDLRDARDLKPALGGEMLGPGRCRWRFVGRHRVDRGPFDRHDLSLPSSLHRLATHPDALVGVDERRRSLHGSLMLTTFVGRTTLPPLSRRLTDGTVTPSPVPRAAAVLPRGSPTACCEHLRQQVGLSGGRRCLPTQVETPLVGGRSWRRRPTWRLWKYWGNSCPCRR